MPRSASSAIPRRPLRLIGGAALALAIALLIATLFWSILAAASGQPAVGSSADIGFLIYITTLQAALSTIFSLIVGIALAWAVLLTVTGTLATIVYEGGLVGAIAAFLATALIAVSVVLACRSRLNDAHR